MGAQQPLPPPPPGPGLFSRGSVPAALSVVLLVLPFVTLNYAFV